MKKNVQIPQYAVILLVISLMLSLTVNVVQCVKNIHDPITLSGTYSKNSPNAEGIYMVFDNKGHFCTYTQSSGIIEEGNCVASEENLYKLTGVSGYNGYVVLTENGIYYSVDSSTMEYLPLLDDTPIFIGNWADNWNHWPDGPYEID